LIIATDRDFVALIPQTPSLFVLDPRVRSSKTINAQEFRHHLQETEGICPEDIAKSYLLSRTDNVINPEPKTFMVDPAKVNKAYQKSKVKDQVDEVTRKFCWGVSPQTESVISECPSPPPIVHSVINMFLNETKADNVTLRRATLAQDYKKSTLPNQGKTIF
jgi:hypothetical protein